MMRLNKLRNMQPITILDKDYLTWVQTLCERYRTSQIKAAVKVNQEMLHYYWLLGKEIDERGDENKYGSAFYATLSRDLKKRMPKATGFMGHRTKRLMLRSVDFDESLLISVS